MSKAKDKIVDGLNVDQHARFKTYGNSRGLDKLKAFSMLYEIDSVLSNPIPEETKRILKTIPTSTVTLSLTEDEVSCITAALRMYDSNCIQKWSSHRHAQTGKKDLHPWWFDKQLVEDLDWKIQIMTDNLPDSW